MMSGARCKRARRAGPRAATLPTLVRAEAALSEMVSEMRIDDDGTRLAFPRSLAHRVAQSISTMRRRIRARREVLGAWRGHEHLIAMLDMTTPGQAVMRLSDRRR